MRELVYGGESVHVPWAEKVIGHRLRPEAKSIAVVDGSRIRAVFAFDGFSQRGCMIHIATDGTATWPGRDFDNLLTRIFAYPFRQCGYARLTALVAASNTRSVQLVTRRGGVLEGSMRKAAVDGGDLLVFGMLREECRWVTGRGRLVTRGRSAYKVRCA